MNHSETMDLNGERFLDSPDSSVDTERASPVPHSPRHSVKKASRVSHTKSRKGCATCKKRKVKCDEQRPACFNCSRLQEDCRYLPVTAKKTSPRPARSPKQNETPRSIGSPQPTVSSSGGINLVDLELFHTFSTSTYSTLFTSSGLREFRRTTVPRLAIQYDYLMGEVLALAALHLAYHRPDQRHQYLSTALTHHQAASQKARVLLKSINQENTDVLFVFSCLTTVVTMATPKRSRLSGMTLEDGDFEDWIYLVQGTAELKSVLGPNSPQSSLAPLFTYARNKWTLHHSFHFTYAYSGDMLYELEHQIRSCVLDPQKLDILIERINSLKSAACQSLDWEASDMFFWLSGGIDGFLPLIKARDQEAWAVLAHFCPMLKKAERQWWLQGWADCTMRKIHQQLDEEYKAWILRPSEEMGWIAP
ncbi:hypothetical protein FGRMN_2996 [Fusarium graminum]|nr:hypothetical protein FGRMN_2996 [Fusarium graminum]